MIEEAENRHKMLKVIELRLKREERRKYQLVWSSQYLPIVSPMQDSSAALTKTVLLLNL